MNSSLFAFTALIFSFIMAFPAFAQKRLTLYGATFSLTFQSKEAESAENISLLNPQFNSIAVKAIQNANDFAHRLATLCDSLNYTDWLRLRLVGEIAKLSFKKPKQKVFAAMTILRAMGYNAGIIVLSKKWQLAVEIDQKIFFATVFEEQNRRYCIYDIEKNKLVKETGESDGFYDANEKLREPLEPLALFQDGIPTLPIKSLKKKITWKFNNEEFALTYEVNQNLVKYLEERPQTDVAIFFNETVTSDVFKNIIEPLKKIIDERKWSRREAVAFLHSFALYGFKYQDDASTKRGEHTNSIEETLVSLASDCEDRSILLSAVIRGALGLKVIGIEFPNHITIAVNIPDLQNEPHDEMYEHKGARYLSADPSCFGDLGNVNPLFKGAPPKRIIDIAPLIFAEEAKKE